MKKLLRVNFVWFVLVALAIPSTAETLMAGELIPTPTFSNHNVPTTEVPHTDATFWQLIDVVLLAVALILATYFALVQRSRRRMLVLTVACLVWFGFVRDGCICSIGATQNVALALGSSSYTVPVGVLAFFMLPLFFALFFGRTFCAAVCPLGAAQELIAVRSMRVPRWIDQSLGLIPYVYLGAAVAFAATGTAFVICRYDPFVAFFRLGGNQNMLIFGSCVLLVGVFVGRPYCRYLCPYGAILAILSRVSKWHLRIVPGDCINCRLCEDACPYGAIQPPTVPQTLEQRAKGKRQLLWSLFSVPVAVAILAWLGTFWAIPLSRIDPIVRLAEQIHLEETGLANETTKASEAFRNTGRAPAQIYQEGLEIEQRCVRIGGWLGAWIGLLLGVKLVQLSLRRQRVDYHPERAGCVSCGRCFKSCPVELVRLGLIEDVSEMVTEETPA